MPPRRKGFFTQEVRPEDSRARMREVEALVAPRRAVVQDLPVERIQPNPFQARRSFADIEELAQTIRAQGFTTRLRVRPHPAEPGTFQLVFGERRLRAAQSIGMAEVPCEIAEHSDEELIEIGLAENIQRRDLDPLEEAQAFQALIAQRGYSIRRLAERIGKDKSYVEDRLALLRTPEDVQQMVARRPDSLRAAREIARLDTPEARRPLIEGLLAGQLSTSDVRGLTRPADVLTGQPSVPARRGVEPSEAARGRLDQDLRAIRAIVTRWKTLLAQGGEQRELVIDYTEQLLLAAQELVDMSSARQTEE